MEITLDELLREMVKLNASDLHISAGNPPIIRLKGKLTRLKGYGTISPENAEKMLTGILSGFQNERLFEEKELDFSYNIPELARFRGNIFRENRAIGGVFRMIPHTPRSLEELNVPLVIKELALKRYGLILVTGPSGAGKTTTLASLVDHMNRTRNSHIVTIEDPIEYVFQNRTCLIRQREVGAHTKSFAVALKSALRQDPDVILVGEMRDRETIDTALTAAETGHLVISTLHTNNAVDTISRIIDIFPGHQQPQIRVQLSATLQGVFSQLLIPMKKRDKGLILATEVLIVTVAIRNMIREGKIHFIRQAMETGGEHGMQTMEQCLKVLYEEGKISLEEAQIHAIDLESFLHILGLSTKKPVSTDAAEEVIESGTKLLPGQNYPAGAGPATPTAATPTVATPTGAPPLPPGVAPASPFRTRTGAKPEASMLRRSKSAPTPKTPGGYVVDDGQSHYYRDPLYADGSTFTGTYSGSGKVIREQTEEDEEF